MDPIGAVSGPHANDHWSVLSLHGIEVINGFQVAFVLFLDYLFDIGELDLNISGCMNACGHHHVGHIGILGVDKNGEEWYQIQVGGNQGKTHGEGPGASLGKVLGPSFARAEVPDVIEKLIQCYLEQRDSEVERFIDVVQRIGVQPFKERVYGQADHRSPSRQRDAATLA